MTAGAGMRFSLSWLADHLDTQADIHTIAETLTDCGLEVEEIVDPSVEFGKFSICRVIEAAQHPNADRLRVCRVETWPDGANKPAREVQVVCGAPNARTGMIGVFAPPGTVIPGTGMLLKKGRIRGEESAGMLCSERELKISDEHDGIIDLPEDAPLGQAYMDYAEINDGVIEIEVTPNRADALGVRGIARDLAARGLGRLKPIPSMKPIIAGGSSSISVTIDDVARTRACPLFSGREIRGVKNGESPAWLRKRLETIGLRPISALVDITNFMTYDQNRPLHVFDSDKISGGLRIHLANGGESLTTLDETGIQFSKGQIAISDDRGPLSIAGIMGGLSTGCTEDTVNVFLESALWDPISIATTGRKLKINSDARYRFERGVDPEFTLPGLDAATRMIVEICGGAASDIVFDGMVPETKRQIRLCHERARQILGMDIPRDRQEKILNDLEFSVDDNGDSWLVTPPSWRPDIHGEADLVEEIGRIASLTRLEAVPLPRKIPNVARQILTPTQKREQVCRRSMASLGYHESVTYSFVDRDSAALFLNGREPVEIDNPISADLTSMRPDLLPGLLKAASANQSRGFNDLALFEVGQVFHGAGVGDETVCVTGVLVGNRSPRQPHGEMRPVDVFDVKSDVEAVLSTLLSVTGLKFARDVPDWMHPGRSGSIFLQPGKPIAVFGELNPKLLRKFDIKGAVASFSIDLDSLPSRRSRSKTRPAFTPASLQHVDRDFAFVVKKDVEAGDVIAAVRRTTSRDLIDAVQIFDEYSGDEAEQQLGAGLKSLAVTVRLQPRDRTLKDSDLEAISADICHQVELAVGGHLRTSA